MTDEANEYELVIARRFLKDMKRLAREDQVRVRKAIINIQTEPYRGRKVIAAETGQYRWRVGNLRVRYDIEGRQVHILRVIKREEAYR
jgi:mRNA-degrading endonuclease RelE of RelBE toxin-antitoxin system